MITMCIHICAFTSSRSPLPPGGHCLGELLAGERSECAVWWGQDVWSGQGRAQGLSGVLH